MKQEPEPIEGRLAVADGYGIGCKVIEMADRLRLADLHPGLQAKWVFYLDDKPYTLTVERGDLME